MVSATQGALRSYSLSEDEQVSDHSSCDSFEPSPFSLGEIDQNGITPLSQRRLSVERLDVYGSDSESFVKSDSQSSQSEYSDSTSEHTTRTLSIARAITRIIEFARGIFRRE